MNVCQAYVFVLHALIHTSNRVSINRTQQGEFVLHQQNSPHMSYICLHTNLLAYCRCCIACNVICLMEFVNIRYGFGIYITVQSMYACVYI